MPEGGVLAIETANQILNQAQAVSYGLAPGQYVVLRVRDNGSGMEPDVVARAFDPFFTTKPIGMGTGLGLSMIYGFARQSGGHALIDSKHGAGTSVSIYLPRYRGEAAEAEPLQVREEPPRAEHGETVLVVDDEPVVRMLVTEVLQELGYAAIEAADGAEGLQILQSGQNIDLLVSDVGLPGGMNGRQVADAARAMRPGLKVLFITGYAENALFGDRQLEPGMHVMTKPFAMEALAARIRAVIEE
jgi:CheY-like chemotaxis protein